MATKKRPVHCAFVEQEENQLPAIVGAPFYATCLETLRQSSIGAWDCKRDTETCVHIAILRLGQVCDAEHIL
jgi:hypothetical protein